MPRRARASIRPLAVLVVLLAILAGLGALANGPLTIDGAATGPDGAPLAQARLTLIPAADPIEAARARLAGRTVEPVAASVAAEDGTFRLTAPAAGAWTVRAEAPGHAPREIRIAPLVESVTLPPVELRSDAGLAVRVVDETGAPVAGALVRLGRPRRSGMARLARAGWETPQAVAFTDGEGRARLPRAEDERVGLGVSARGFLPERLASVRGTSVTVRLAPGAAAPIVVTDTDGSPVAGALVAFDRGAVLLGFTGAQGGLVAALPKDERVEITVSAPGGREATRRGPFRIADGAPLRVTLPATWTVRGRIVDTERATGIAGGVVHDAERPWLLATTDAGGRFALTLSGGGRVRLVAAATGYLPQGGHAFSRDEVALVPPAIPLRPAAAIEGVVIDAEDAPVRGARLSLEERRSSMGNIEIRIGGEAGVEPGGVTGPDGRFRIAPVDPSKRWRVVARADGYARAAVDVDGLAPYETRGRVRLVASRGIALAGVVVDGEERAIPGASVEAAPAVERDGPGAMMRLGGGPTEEPARALSDADGRFAVDGLAEGRYDLTVRRDGFATARVPGVDPAESSGDGALRVTLEPGVTLEGRVTSETGAPLEGVSVSVSSGGRMMPMMLPGMPTAEPDALSGPDGWFAVGGFARGDRVSVSLSRRGFARASRTNVELPAAPVEIEMTPSSTLSGVVLDEAGEPVAGASISLDRTMRSSMGGAEIAMQIRETGETEADGTFLFEDLEPGEVGLEASGFGHGTASRTLRIPAGEDLAGVELSLPAGAVVTGEVLLTDGRPARDARVGTVGEAQEMPGLSGTATDADGRYVLEGVEPGRVTIEALGPGRQRVVKEIDAEPGVNTLDLRFEGGVDLSGAVVGDAGSGLAGAVVHLLEPGREWGGPERRTDRDGRFTFEGIRPGDYRLAATHDAHAPGEIDAPITVGSDPVDGVVIRLTRGATIAGSVAGLDDADLRRVSVTAFGPGFASFRAADVDHRGRFRVENVEPGRWEIRGRIGGEGRQARAEIDVADGVPEIPMTLTFGTGTVLRGLVLQDDRPVDGATIFVEGVDVASSGWSETDADGRFVVDGLDDGRFRVNVRSWRTGLSHAEEVSVDGETDVRIDVPTTRLVGVVVDAADGEPIAGARVTLVPAGDGAGGAAGGAVGTHATTSDLDGHFVLTPVTDGEWELAAEKQGFAVERTAVSIAEGRAPDELTLRLDATEGITVLARLPSGRPAEEVSAAVFDIAGASLTSGTYATGEGGKLRIGSVPPGRWRVALAAPGSGVRTVSLSAPGAPVAVDLPPATSLRVLVPALADAPRPATMSVAAADGSPFVRMAHFGAPRTEWRAGAETMVERLPPGRWIVTVRAADGTVLQGSAETATGRVSEIVLE